MWHSALILARFNLKQVWYWWPCAPNQIFIKAGGSKIKSYSASGQSEAGFGAATGVAHHGQMQELDEVAVEGPQGPKGSTRNHPAVTTVMGWVMYHLVVDGGDKDATVWHPALGEEKEVGKEGQGRCLWAGRNVPKGAKTFKDESWGLCLTSNLNTECMCWWRLALVRSWGALPM